MNWKKIDSAPRDGRQFLAWDGNSFHALNWPAGCALGSWEKYKDEWTGWFVSFEATHWMPLPSPPTSAEAQPVLQEEAELVRLDDIALEGYNSSLVPSARLGSTATTRLAMANAVEAILAALPKQPASTPALREVTEQDVKDFRYFFDASYGITFGSNLEALSDEALRLALEAFRHSLSTK